MLKIENNKGTITISLKKKNKRFTKDFFFAFLIAVAFHAGFFLLFYISPTKVPSSFLYSPISVEANEKSHTAVHTSLEKKKQSLFFEKMQHYLENEPLLELQHKEKLFLSPDIKSVDFSSMDLGLQPRWHMSPSNSIEWPLIEWRVEGNLKNYALIEKPALMNKTSLVLEDSPFYLSYEVRMETSQGTIFWWRALDSIQQKKIEEMGERMLRSLKFKTEGGFKIVSGTLYFVLYPSLLEQLHD